MAGNKRYYYMRLKEDFFDSPEMKTMESMRGGYKYSLILLKLYLLSLRDNGRLTLKNNIPYDVNMLAKLTGFSKNEIENALKIFRKFELVEVLDTGTIYMLDIQAYIGETTSEADRKREYRSRIEAEKTGHLSGHLEDISTPEIEIEKELELDTEKTPPVSPKGKAADKTQYAEFVTMTEREYSSLCERVGERGAKRCIEILDNYKGASGKKYASDYRAILSWVIARYEEEPEPEPEEPTVYDYPTPEENVLTDIEDSDTLADLLKKINAEEVRP